MGSGVWCEAGELSFSKFRSLVKLNKGGFDGAALEAWQMV